MIYRGIQFYPLVAAEMDRITFSVNGLKCSVGGEVSSDTTLNDYIRRHLDLPGTKYMCKEGVCGSCIVAATVGHRTMSLNSCLVLVAQCQDWEVTTIEGIGDRRKGYHPVQKTLAEHDGTQCGFCSPGWVMSMYSLLESNHYDLTMYEIEDAFASNTCRCTGYRPILDAFKTFAKDAPKPTLTDIEDLKPCSKENCKKDCRKEWCVVGKSEVNAGFKKIALKDDRIWFRVTEIQQIFDVFETEGTDSYMLVRGNSSKAPIPILAYPRVLIDVSQVDELKGYYLDQNLIIGAGTTLSDLMEIFLAVSEKHEEFQYLKRLYDHLNLVAHIPVRNVASIAGNLMVKHRKPEFSSDVFLLFESIGATLTITTRTTKVEVSPEQFLTVDMTGKLLTLVKIPPYSHNYKFVSFKVMPRSQNAHAQVNGAFLYEFDTHYPEPIVLSARIVITGLSAEFVHARKTEAYVMKKNIFTNEVLQGALKILAEELVVKEIAGELKPEYRKKCALGLFYKGLLCLIPQQKLKPFYRSGAEDLRKTRPLSKGKQEFDTNPILWPVTEPMPKVEALIQCAGEANYVNDIPEVTQEVYCAFVTSDICTGEILEIDPTPALKVPGVLAFFSAKDIPGRNSYIPARTITVLLADEEIFADGRVKYYDQPIGVIVAESETLANRAALLVRIKYKKDLKKPVLYINDAKEREPERVSLFLAVPARDRGANVQRVINDTHNIYWQYHYSMETLSCVSRPNDDGIDVFPAAQWPDLNHAAIAAALNIESSRVNLTIPRCGGAYGIKISRTAHVATACALVTYLMNRPCRFVMSMQANLRCIGQRSPCTRDFEVAVDDSGEIQYMTYNIYTDNGYVINESLIAYMTNAVRNCYDNRRWQMKFFNVTTDTRSNTFCRAPGSLEAIAMTEYVMEQISYEIDRDPLQVRLRNLNPMFPELAEMIETLTRDAEYYKRRKEVEKFNKQNRWKKRGLRVALMGWPLTSLNEFHVLLSVFHSDATVSIKHGGIEIGQGINTKIIQTVAYTLKIPMNKVKVKPADVTAIPNSFTVGGSRSTQAVCFGVIKCCQQILDRLTVIREALPTATWEEVIQAAYKAGINLQTSYRVTSNDLIPYRVGGVAFTEVELDILTGEHDVIRTDIIQDAGTSINPEGDIGQVEGSFIMGLGYWTHEVQIFDEKTGELLTDRSWYYHVPLSKDIPIDFRIQLRKNSFNPVGPLGSKGASEPATTLAICVAFALREAIAASREDTGYPRTKWFNVDGPYTLEANVLKADVRLDEFLYY